MQCTDKNREPPRLCEITKFMLTVQTNIALQLVRTLSEEEIQAFANEFEKIIKPVAKIKPKKKKEFLLPDPNVLAQMKLAEHRAKNNTMKQD